MKNIIKRKINICIITLVLIASCVNSAEWGYETGEITPDQWGNLHGFETCSTGNKQSPIDLNQSELSPDLSRVMVTDLPDLYFNYHQSPLDVINNGHTVEFEYETGSIITLESGGEAFEILQFHFHAPAEHSFEQGALYEMEMHIVHRSLSNPNQLAVVGVMIRQGEHNQVLAPIWDNAANLLNTGDHVSDHSRYINIDDALPSDRRYFSYSGSLTTPPCSEIVEWRILRNPIEMSLEQISSFISILDNSCCASNGNNRPIQNLNNREVLLDEENEENEESDDG